MKQSRLMSFIEACGNTLSGFFISLFAQWLLLPLIMGVPISFQQNLIFAVLMTAISIVRSFGWRRLMEALHIRHPVSPFATAALAERRRQIEVEGWSHEHDEQHDGAQLARAGGCYAIHAGTEIAGTPLHWPWSHDWWKPAGFRRDLVKAAALIIAEGERFDRNRRPVRSQVAGAGVTIKQGRAS